MLNRAAQPRKETRPVTCGSLFHALVAGLVLTFQSPMAEGQVIPPPPVPVPSPGTTAPPPTEPPPTVPPSTAEPPVLPGAIAVPGPGTPGPGTPGPGAPGSPPPTWIRPEGGTVVIEQPPWVSPPRPGRPAFAPPGWFGAFGIDIVGPDISNGLVAPVTVSGVTTNVQLPAADLHWTGSPRVELGYRLPDGLGEFVAVYRAVITEGTESIANFDAQGQAFLKTRLNFNVIDLDYSTGLVDVAPRWDFGGTIGLRIAAIYFDSRATGNIVGERTSNNFVGAGPHAAFDVTRSLDLIPGLALYSRLDGALVIGGVSQAFERTVQLGGGTEVGGATNVDSTQAAPVLFFQLGLSYMPPLPDRWVRFTLGYQIERWWSIGNAGASRGDLTIQGFFFRTQFDF